ncbi:MAG: hypothetical protein WBC06_02000, partial [Chitinophagaceae bacterium]
MYFHQIKKVAVIVLIALFSFLQQNVFAQRWMEKLGRGLVAIRTNANEVFLSWRLLGTDPDNTTFNIYRDAVKINTTPLTGATNFKDNISVNGKYIVKAVINGIEETTNTETSVRLQQYFQIPLQPPAGGTTPD